MPRLKIAFPYLLAAGLVLLVVAWNAHRAPAGPHSLDAAAPTAPAAGESGAAATAAAVDPVCHMAVDVRWGFWQRYETRTYHFCTARCRDLFAADPARYLTQRCLVCGAPIDPQTARPATYLGRTYLLDSKPCRARFKADPAAYFMHRMWGLPGWLYYVSIALILLLSFVMFEGMAAFRRGLHSPSPRGEAGRGAELSDASVTESSHRQSPSPQPSPSEGEGVGPSPQPSPSEGEGEAQQIRGGAHRRPAETSTLSLPVLKARSDRIDLMRVTILRRLFTSRPTRFVLQLAAVLLFALIIVAGLFGNQNPALNIAPLLTWTLWWGGLVVLIMFAGKAWCYVCPWDAVAGWTEKLRFWRKAPEGLGLSAKWPRRLRNIWLATFLFIGLTWLELGFGITMKPAATAYLAVGMLVLSIACAFMFDRKSFCRYGCLVGRVSGLYALFAGVEVRAADADVCRTCATKECIKGSDTAYGCPTFEYPGKMAVNTYCIQCGECLQACPHENMTVRLRPWGADLAAPGKPRSDEAYLALLMLAISGFHGLTMTPLWRQMTDAIGAGLSLHRVAAFTLAMAALMAAPILVYAALVWLSHRIARAADPLGAVATYRDYFLRYAYCVLPIALFYHLAHNLEHLLMEGPKVVALASDPMGWGWNLLGTAGWRAAPLASLDVLWLLQVILVAVGHVYSLWAARGISRRMFTNPTAASRSQWPMLLGMIAFSIFSLWLLKQPMEMRTSAM